MKILCITPGNEQMKTPETGFAELLRKRGHQVYLQYTGYSTRYAVIDRGALMFNPDVIWGMMEYSIPTAVIYKHLLNKPVYAHIECIPPWRTGIETPEEYGFDYEMSKPTMDRTGEYRQSYKDMIDNFNACDAKTISGESWRYTFEKLTREPLVADVRYYTYDNAPLKQYEKPSEEKNQICTISRLTPTKRIHHTIQALALIPKEDRPAFKIIGYGDQQDYLYKLADELEVDMSILGSGKDGLKEKTIQESMFMVQNFSAIPVLESAYYKKPCISYGTPHMKEVFGDMCTWVEPNNIEKLRDRIIEFSKNANLRRDCGKNAHDIMVNNKSNVYNNDQFLDAVEEQLNKAIKNWGEDK